MKKLLLALLFAASLFGKEMEAVLAAQWFASVCKVKRYKECRRPHPFWLENFTLHGLWPKGKSYCKVPVRVKILDKRGHWDRIPLELSPKIRELLTLYMPGAISGLHKHEWVKHGSCYGPPDLYFLHSIALIEQLNRSEVRDFFLRHRGKLVQGYKIRRAFDKAFGKGSGKRVRIVCEKGYITELRLSLKGKISSTTPLSTLLLRARPVRMGCTLGRIGR